MRRVTMVAALVLTGLLLQGEACSSVQTEAVVEAFLEDPEEVAKREAEREAEERKQREEERNELAAAEHAREEERQDYFREVVVPTNVDYGPGEYSDYLGDLEDAGHYGDDAWVREEDKKFAEWREKRAKAAKAEENYYDSQILGGGQFPSLEAYREEKAKNPAFRAAEDAKQATWERKRAEKKAEKKKASAGEGGGGGGGGGAGGGGGEG